MSSQSLRESRTDRLPRLNVVDAQNVALATAHPANPQAIDENLRGFVMLLSAHFQGFCRDLHTQCAQAVATAVPAAMLLMFQTLCGNDRALDGSNPKYASIKADFERFGFDLTYALTADPALTPAVKAANAAHITRVNHLNSWRNYAAHHNKSTPHTGRPVHPDHGAGVDELLQRDGERIGPRHVQSDSGARGGTALVDGGHAMTAPQSVRMKRGDRVKIISGGGLTGRVVELRGPLGPNGMLVYRVILRKRPKPAHVEVREDQLELLPGR